MLKLQHGSDGWWLHITTNAGVQGSVNLETRNTIVTKALEAELLEQEDRPSISTLLQDRGTLMQQVLALKGQVEHHERMNGTLAETVQRLSDQETIRRRAEVVMLAAGALAAGDDPKMAAAQARRTQDALDAQGP